MKTESFDPAEIVVPTRMRARLDEMTIAALVESIKRIGLREPPTVRWAKNGDEDQIILVTGRHRVEACKRLGMAMVDCVIFEGDDTDARLWEIAENLYRAELSVQERADHIAEWVRLTEDKKPPQDGAVSEGRGNRGGIREAARVLPVSGETEKAREHQIERALKIAGLSSDARAVADEAGLDSQKDRLEIANVEADKQAAKARELAKRKSDRRLVQTAGDDIVQLDADDEAALMILDYMPGDMVLQLLSWLDAAKHHKLTAAIRREQKTGARRADRPVFDQTRAGTAA